MNFWGIAAKGTPTLLGVTASALIVIEVFAYSSGNLETRLVETQGDIELFQQGKYAGN